MHKKYKVVGKILLSFNDREEGQADYIIDDGTVEFDGHNILRMGLDGNMYESITQNHAIDVWLKEGKLEEIKETK